MSQTLNILIVSADPMARAALGMTLADLPGYNLVAQVDSGMATAVPLHALTDDPIDVIIWDLGWETAVSDIPSFEEIGPPVITLIADPDLASLVWLAGARGILARELDPNKLLAAVTAVSEGLFVAAPRLANTLMPDAPPESDEDIETLTPREHEVLQLLAEGLTNKAIAQKLAVSEHTIKFHVNAIMGKLNAQSRTEAVVRATRLGLIIL